ncbi:MAG: response regulator transcription factor [Trueperaceae bacterium]|nr:MAG: response regulator transcription factor [Trueperaceae bacterium]
MHLLIVEDEKSLADTLRLSLEAHGFQPICAYSASEAWEALWQHPFDLIVLDVMLPEGEEAGFRLSREVRDAGFHQPILFLTARERLPDRIRGLEFGDDYLAKPFALAELIARLKALYRRGEMRPRQIVWRDIVLCVEERQVRLQDTPVRLTAKEYEVLELLMLNPGRVFSREDVLDRIWGLEFEPNSNLIDVYVGNLRTKLGDMIIETVRGMGYRFPD